jgi:hypothetical protein
MRRPFFRPNAPTLPGSRLAPTVPYIPGDAPDVAPPDYAPSPPADPVADPFTVSVYDVKPMNGGVFYEPFTGLATNSDDQISPAMGNIIFGDSGGEFVVPQGYRFLIRRIDIAFFTNAAFFYEETLFGIAPGFANPSLGGAYWSLLVNGGAVQGFSRRAIVGSPGEKIPVEAYVLVESGAAVSLMLEFAVSELSSAAVYGAVTGDSIYSTGSNIQMEPVNNAPIPVGG